MDMPHEHLGDPLVPVSYTHLDVYKRQAQPWCNGKVGLLGISYFAINQWFVANLQPPSLKAIVPWEGFADLYRDALYHGGLLACS